MATRGRTPKPTALKKLEGNPGHRPLNEREPQPKKKLPSCPGWLEKEAKKEWRRLCKALDEMGILKDVDMVVFADYCQSYARWRQAEEFLSERGLFYITPSGYPQQFPQVQIALNYSKQMIQHAKEMGLTPAARSRLIAGSEGARDEMDELLED